MVWAAPKPAASLHCIAFSCKCIAHKNYIGLQSNEILHIWLHLNVLAHILCSSTGCSGRKVDFLWIGGKIVHCKSRAVPWTDDPWMECSLLPGSAVCTKVHQFISAQWIQCIVVWYSAVRGGPLDRWPLGGRSARAPAKFIPFSPKFLSKLSSFPVWHCNNFNRVVLSLTLPL